MWAKSVRAKSVRANRVRAKRVRAKSVKERKLKSNVTTGCVFSCSTHSNKKERAARG